MPKTAFVTRNGTYEFRVAPQGLQNSGAGFSFLMARLFQGLEHKHVIIYLDDLLVWSKSFDSHLKHLKAVFDRLREANLRLNPEKTQLCARECLYLGHKITPEGVKVDDSKVKIIRKYPRPHDVKSLRRFLGLVGYHRNFIRAYSIICSPLYRLLRKDEEFVWDEPCEKAFIQLREALVTAPDQLISCGGRSLRGSELYWDINNKEALAAVSGVKDNRIYLRSGPFKI